MLSGASQLIVVMCASHSVIAP